jgi:hypothetical protein
MTGTIDKVGGDIKRIKDMGVEHIIFGYSSLPKGNDVNNMIDITFLNFVVNNTRLPIPSAQ